MVGTHFVSMFTMEFCFCVTSKFPFSMEVLHGALWINVTIPSPNIMKENMSNFIIITSIMYVYYPKKYTSI